MWNIAEKIAEMISRRSFLERVPIACAAVVLSVCRVWGGNPYGTYGVACCNLCEDNNCTGSIPSNWGCEGIWCWTCPYGTQPNCTIWQCMECYNSNASQSCFNVDGQCDNGDLCVPGACSNLICSKAINTYAACN